MMRDEDFEDPYLSDGKISPDDKDALQYLIPIIAVGFERGEPCDAVSMVNAGDRDIVDAHIYHGFNAFVDQCVRMLSVSSKCDEHKREAAQYLKDILSSHLKKFEKKNRQNVSDIIDEVIQDE